jgi:hypothetical protein
MRSNRRGSSLLHDDGYGHDLAIWPSHFASGQGSSCRSDGEHAPLGDDVLASLACHRAAQQPSLKPAAPSRSRRYGLSTRFESRFLTSAGTISSLHMFKRTDARRIIMSGMFNSPLMVGGGILLGICLTIFVGALIATLSDRMRTTRR